MASSKDCDFVLVILMIGLATAKDTPAASITPIAVGMIASLGAIDINAMIDPGEAGDWDMF